MKKLIALLFVFGFIVFSAPQVHASVLSDALLKIQNLQKEVEQLKTQIGAAVYSSRYNSYLGGTSSGSTTGTTTDCQSGEIFSYSTGQRCPTAPVVIPTPTTPTAPVVIPTPTTPTAPVVIPTPTVIDVGCQNGAVYNLTTGKKCSNAFFVDLKVNGSDNPEAVKLGSKVNISWSIKDSDNSITKKPVICYPFGNNISGWTESSPITAPTGSKYGETKYYDSRTDPLYYFQIGLNCNGVEDSVKIPILSPTPSITVLSPNGGEVYQAGEKITVKWSSVGVLADAKLELNVAEKDGKIFGFLGKDFGTVNDGIEVIDTTGWPASSGYKIIVGIPFVNNQFNNSNLSINDESDNYFTIKAATIVASGCSGTVMYDPITGKLCPIGVPIIGTSDVKIYSPKGGEIFKQGLSNVISWTGGTSKVQIGVASADYTGVDGTLLGWIELNGKPNSSTTWDGGTLKALDGSIISQVISGKYKIVAVSKSEEGNYCSGSNANTSGPKIICNYDLSGLITVKPASSVDTGCQAGAVYSYTTGSKCPVPTVIDMGCQAGAVYSNTTGQACPVDNKVTTTPITRTLKQGVIGDDVKTLQEFLGLKTDGVYGRGTAVKVKEWQRLNGLNPDGAFGSMSRETAGLK